MSANNQSAQGNDNHINLYEPHVWKHHTKVAGLEWKNPVGTASGTFQYAAVRWFYDVSQLGAVCTKGASPVPWEGNPSPRAAESPAANINAVGLQNPGVDHYLAEDLPKLKAAGAFVISNVAGHCDDDYAEVVEKLADSDADMLEINVSCPNVSAGGMSVGADPVALANLMDRLRPLTDKPMIVKLTPNVTDITVPARAAVEHGADALSMINTLKGMRINIRNGEPIIANVTGGVSGPAVLPIGLAAVYHTRTVLPDIPIIGLGGIDSGEKALEYLYAGANAVEVGAAALFDPVAPLRVARELDDLLDSRPELAAKLAAGQLVDDVMTAGTAVREVIPKLKAEANVEVVGLVLSVDRMEKTKDSDLSAVKAVEAEFGFPVLAIANVREIFDAAAKMKNADSTPLLSHDIQQRAAAYLEEYGA